MSFKKTDSDTKQGQVGAGGLLANVSLLTTGGSSLQHQLTNNDMQLASTKNQTLSGSSLQPKDKLGTGKINTSTPAKPFLTSNIVYGFDLSPVHSYEMPSTSTKDHQDSAKVTKDKSQLIFQDKLEDDLFVDKKSLAAPNFMQAPAISSPHQSRISTRASDDTETMMSQVYSQTPQSKSTKCQSPRPSKKGTKSTKSHQKSPSYVSPRKTSKSYSHIQGSGYGLTSPWKPSIKNKTEDKKKNVLIPKKKTKNKKKNVQVISNTDVSQPYVEDTNRDFNSAHLRNLSGTYKVERTERNDVKKMPVSTTLDDSQLNTSQLSSYKKDTDYKVLENRFNALEKEYSLLKAGHDEVNKENFLLSAKLNKLVKATDSTDPAIKDSLNDDNKTIEITLLKKEVLEQERLLKGYQQENEKLYSEMAKIKTINRENESAMFNENLKLKNKLASLREELNDKVAIIREKNQLLLDERNLKPRVLNRCIQTDQLLKKDDVDEKADYLKELHDKLSWYAKNTAMLEEKCRDYDSAMENVVELKLQIASLNKQIKANDSAKLNESHRAEDLHRQVKELESIVSRSQTEDHVKTLIHGDSEKELMRQHTKQLELRLKKQEESFSNSMQSLHRLYKKMSSDYEERVNNLSEQLELLKQQNVQKPLEQQIPTEHILLAKQENSQLQLQIESLQRELLDERKKNEDLTISLKKKERTALQKSKPESVYHPGYFIEKPSNQVQSSAVRDIDEISREVITPQKVKEAIDKEHQLLSKEILHWKNQYEEMKTSCDVAKNEYVAKVESLKSKYEESINELQLEKAALVERATTAELKLSRVLVELSSSKTCEEALQFQIKNLLDELHETRRGSSNATIRQLQSLQSQIKVLNFRQRSREEKLDKVVETSADDYLRAEINNLRNVISDKDHLLTKFRYELDAILRVLENLQKDKL